MILRWTTWLGHGERMHHTWEVAEGRQEYRFANMAGRVCNISTDPPDGWEATVTESEVVFRRAV